MGDEHPDFIYASSDSDWSDQEHNQNISDSIRFASSDSSFFGKQCPIK